MAIEGVSLAFSANMLAVSPTWTRLDSTPNLVASYSIRRGRQDEMAKTGTGTASILINDTEGDFEPSFIGSPYFGNLDDKQVGIALWNPVTEAWTTIFRGFTESYDYEVEPSGVVTRTTLDAVDAMEYLAGAMLVPGTAGHTPPGSVPAGNIYYEADTVDERIKAALTNANWPVSLRTIFTGNVTVQPTVYPVTNCLQVLQDAADAEFPGVANIYITHNGANAGKVTFHGRHARFDPDTTAAGAGSAWNFTRWKAGDGSITSIDTDYAQIRGLSFRRARTQVINDALATPFRDETDPLTDAELAGQEVIDAASVTARGVRSWSAENLITLGHITNGTTDLEETKLFAEYYVNNFAEIRTRVSRLTFRSIRPDDPRGPATWALLAGVEVSDIIELRTVHPGGGGFEDEPFYVEGISYEVRPLNADYLDVTLQLDVTPAAYWDPDTNPFDD